ncbi:hypothetical protein [Paracoccus endophyticus]|uniref:hypothetical protein n=1 Tax=Paracoccus endophyticus TaxID=2233774 RepID=UPI001F0B8D17|nr:hypothetical protein [Paracoccus endophyticus]
MKTARLTKEQISGILREHGRISAKSEVRPCSRFRHARQDGPTKEGGGGMMRPDESPPIFVPLTVRKQNGRPKIMPPATCLPREDRTQDPHVLRAINRARDMRRRMKAGEFNRVTDLAKAVGLPNAMSADSCGSPISRRGSSSAWSAGARCPP